jgi:hypothetical protein
MDKFDETLNQLKDSSGGMKPNLHILNEIVPIEVQMKYFQYSKHVQSDKQHTSLDRNYLIAKLFTPDLDVEDRRYYLSVLAGIIDVAAYRAIETYHSSPLEPELADWSAMALIESKVLLDAELSGEKQFFVSTGLGGHDGMLRFFAVIASANRDDFTILQQEILLRELRFAFEQHKIEPEDITVKGNYVKILLLCGLDYDARIIIENAIKECNELGNFVDSRFILTNIKKLDDSDIESMLEKK